MAIIPNSFIGALANGDLLQVLLVSILSGFAIAFMGPAGEPIAHAIDMAAVFFGVIRIIVRAARSAHSARWPSPSALTDWRSVESGGADRHVLPHQHLFVLFVLGGIAWFAGFSIIRFIAYIKDELLIVLGTSSSETVLPNMITKMERLGASRGVVGLVIPTGYSFNLDGTNIYMTLATVPGAGDQHSPHDLAGTGNTGCRDRHIERRVWGHWRGIYYARRDACDRAGHSDCVARHSGRHRQVHERVPGAHQSDRQRRRDHRDQPVGGRTRQG
jgi:Na+/serine symporter